MSPTTSSTGFNTDPPTTFYLTNVVPLSGETATAIASHGAHEVPKHAIDIGSVVRAYIYMDSIFFAADVQCQLADPANLEDERTLYEKEMLEHLGERTKFRPCVVIGSEPDPDAGTRYLLCPMAAFHEEEGGDSRQSHKDLKEPVSLLVRPVQTTDDNETFGAYISYRFEPEWDNGPQYLFPVQVSRNRNFVTNHWLEQAIDENSLGRLLQDIKEVSNVWKKWRKAEHILAKSDEDIPWFKSEWTIHDWNRFPTQWKAYPSREIYPGHDAKSLDGYLRLTHNMAFTKETDDDVPWTDDYALSEEGSAPLPALDVHDGHTRSRTPPEPYQTDFLTPGSSRTSYGSKEMPDSHPTVPAPSPRVTSLPTGDIIPTKITSQSPHGEPSHHSGDFPQGHGAAGAIGDAHPELEGPSDMDVSSVSNASSSQLKYLAERHSIQSSERSNCPSLVRQDLATPKVEDKTSHSSQHLFNNSVESLHRDPNFLPESDRITVEARTLKAVLDGDPSVSSWKNTTMPRGVKRACPSDNELSTTDRRPKRQRTTQN